MSPLLILSRDDSDKANTAELSLCPPPFSDTALVVEIPEEVDMIVGREELNGLGLK